MSLASICFIVGTGYIGVELAGIFHTLGSEVTIFSRTKQILRSFDTIIKDTLLKEMQAVGVNFVFDSDVRSIFRATFEGSPKIVKYLSDGKEGEKEFDCVLWAVGREPNIDGLNLKAAGITTKDNGYIVVDEYQNTASAGVYALGDVCGQAELTPGIQYLFIKVFIILRSIFLKLLLLLVVNFLIVSSVLNIFVTLNLITTIFQQ